MDVNELSAPILRYTEATLNIITWSRSGKTEVMLWAQTVWVKCSSLIVHVLDLLSALQLVPCLASLKAPYKKINQLETLSKNSSSRCLFLPLKQNDISALLPIQHLLDPHRWLLGVRFISCCLHCVYLCADFPANPDNTGQSLKKGSKWQMWGRQNNIDRRGVFLAWRMP